MPSFPPVVLAAVLLSLVTPAQGPRVAVGPGDLRIDGATVYVAADAAPRRASILLRNGRIVFVGDEHAVREASPKASMVSFPGAFVFPGWSDAHGHLLGLGKSLETADLKGSKDAAEAAARVGAVARKLPPGGWAEGRGWDQNRWPGGAYPDAKDLDAAVSDRPAVARRVDGHAIWVSSAALAKADVTAATKDPAGGRILRRPDGSPSGVLVDNAMDLVVRKMPESTPADFERQIVAAARACARLGLTEVQDASGYGPREIDSLTKLADAGGLPIRIYATVSPEDSNLTAAFARGRRTGAGRDFLTVRAIKAYADGALGSRGAALLADYTDEPGNRGLLVTEPERLAAIAERARRDHWQLWIHAIGDRGNRVALDALSRSAADRPRIEHAQVIALEDIPRFAQEGVIASIQPTHATSDMGWAEKRVGAERIRGAYAWRRLLASGAKLAGGSDFPVESENPLLGFYAAITRQDLDGKPEGGWRPEERLSRPEALALFTSGAAWAAFEEDRRGRIEPGFEADLTIFDADPLTAPPERIPKIRVVATMVGGRLVHGDAR
jgi:predicted amidohydrolase YtcJ